MSFKKYYFKTPQNNELYNDVPLDIIKFYQICAFPNKYGLYEVREVIANENNEISISRVIQVKKNIHVKLLKTFRDNKYKIYPVLTLRDVPLPSINDISVARSMMLNVDNDYSGYAIF